MKEFVQVYLTTIAVSPLKPLYNVEMVLIHNTRVYELILKCATNISYKAKLGRKTDAHIRYVCRTIC